jgi:leucyl aminopeptidase (aminopeptidase T)
MGAKLSFTKLDFFRAAASGLTSKGTLKRAANIAFRDVLRARPDERALIIANPQLDAALIAMALYDAAFSAGVRPVLIFQDEKNQMDFAEPAVIAALESKPEIVISISSDKLGKDEYGMRNPYTIKKIGRRARFDHLFHFMRCGEHSCRAFWSPGISADIFCRTVPLDYTALRASCEKIRRVLDQSRSVHVRAPAGTDIEFGLKGRTAKADDGEFSRPGSGGNLPAGEVYISPQNGTARGTIVFDGSMSLGTGDIILREPVICEVEGGFVREIHGGPEAQLLRETIARASQNAFVLEKEGRLAAGMGEVYARNARNIGELGIGLNSAARIGGNMLEDEKAFGTCHFAIGQNYDEDAPALIHLDALVQKPTIQAAAADGGCDVVIMEEGVPL